MTWRLMHPLLSHLKAMGFSPRGHQNMPKKWAQDWLVPLDEGNASSLLYLHQSRSNRSCGSDFIFYNRGLQHLMHPPSSFTETVRRDLAFLLTCKPAALFVRLTTAINMDKVPESRRVYTNTRRVLRFNEILREVAAELSLPVLDAYGTTTSVFHAASDAVHYTGPSLDALARTILQAACGVHANALGR